jgi:uncharacterized repeat protein (TIGR01451 family)
MPDNDVIVYAKWAPPLVNAHVFDKMYGGNEVDKITVDYGGTVDQNLMPNVKNKSGEYIVYTSSTKSITIPDNAIWIGWDVEEKDSDGNTSSYNTYSFDTQLTEDINLYPHYFVSNKYHITYDANGGGNAPSDSRNYAGGNNCYADALSGGNLIPPSEKVFLYWNTVSDGSGTTYYSDDKVAIVDKDVTLYAIYGDDPDATSLTYYSNYPVGTGLAEASTKHKVNDKDVLINNQDLTVYGLSDAKVTTPDSYVFVGWNTQSDGKGTFYSPGAKIGVDVKEPQPNALYAIWQKNPTKDVYQSSDDKTSIDGQTVKAGDELLYKITYKNTTGKDATVTITDTIPENSTYVENSADNGGSFAKGELTWSNLSLKADESVTVSFKVKVTSDDGVKLENQANVNDGTNDYKTNETTNPTGQNPKKDVFQSSDENTSIDGQTVKAGDELLYKITYKNTTGKDAKVTITDTIPENSTYVENSADNGGSYAKGELTWSNLSLKADESVTVSFKVKVASDDGVKLENQANVNDGTNDYKTNETTNPTGQNPKKDVFQSSDDKTSIDGQTVKAGDELLYKITYKNTTGKDATVTITDTIPENSTYVENSADNGGSYADGKLTWNDVAVAADQSVTVSFKVKVDSSDGTTLKNTATVNDGNNSYDTNETTNPTGQNPKKDVYQSSDDKTSIDGQTVKAGDELLYKITYKNTTGKDATVTITDTIPENSTYVENSADNGGSFADGKLTWNDVAVAADQSVTVSFKVKVDSNDGTTLKNTGTVKDGENSYDTNETTNPTGQNPKKDVYQSSDDKTSIDGQTVKAGDELLYKITYKNTTGKDATVTITDTIPENSTYVENSADNGGSYADGKLTWNDVAVAADQSVTVSFRVKVDSNDGTTLENTATVNDGNNSYDTNETTNPTGQNPKKDVFQSSDDKTSIDGQTVKAGDELLYKITYKNTTGKDAKVTITDTIPENSTYVENSADNGGSYAKGKLTWSNLSLKADESVTVSFKVKVASDDGVKLENQANVNDGTNDYKTNETTNPTGQNPKKDVFQSSDDKTSIDGQTVKAGDELLYKITYKNTTGKDATVTITDTIPENSTYVENSADNGGSYAKGELTWSNLSLKADESVTVSFKVKVASDDGVKLENQANVNDGTNDYKTNETTNPTGTRTRRARTRR